MNVREVKEKAAKYNIVGRSQIKKENLQEWIQKIAHYEEINHISDKIESLSINYPCNLELGVKLFWNIDSHPITILTDKRDSSLEYNDLIKDIFGPSKITRRLLFDIDYECNNKDYINIPNDGASLEQIILAIYGFYNQLRGRSYLEQIDPYFYGLYGSLLPYMKDKLSFQGIIQINKSDYHVLLNKI